MKSFLVLLLGLSILARCHAAVETNIVYGTAAGESLCLDACVPDGPGPFPAVILVHGGAWFHGDKNGGDTNDKPGKGYMVPMQEPLTRAGFAWFSINYRLAPEHPYPACVEDVETAIRWVKANAARYRGASLFPGNPPVHTLSLWRLCDQTRRRASQRWCRSTVSSISWATSSQMHLYILTW